MPPISPPQCTEAKPDLQDLARPYEEVKSQALDYAYLLIGDIDRARDLLRETRELIHHAYPDLPHGQTLPGLLKKWLRVRHLHDMKEGVNGAIYASH